MRITFSPYFLLVVTALCWSGNHVLGRAVHNDMQPFALAFWRWALALAVLLPFVACQAWKCRPLVRRHWLLLLVLAALGMSINHGFLYLALNKTTAVNVGLINAMAPIIIPMVSFLIDREMVTTRQATGIAVSLVGVLTIITRADLGVLLGLRFTPGDLYMLVSVLVWAVYSVLLKRLPPGLPPMVFLLVLSAVAALFLLPLYVWEVLTVGGFALNVPNFLTLAYIGLFPSVVAYVCWNQGVAQIGANKAALFNYLIPVFTVGLAVLLLGEAIYVYHAAGAALAVIGIYLTTSARLAAPNGAGQ